MNFIREHKILITLLLITTIIVGFFVIRYLLAKNEIYTESYLDGKDYTMIPKKYGVNEYSIINVNDEQMAINYLNDYKNNLYYDIVGAYNSLNSNYRDAKFQDINAFENYVDTLQPSTMVIDKYSISNCGNYKCYNIYDKAGNTYIFKTVSVMEYELYLDDTTVDILR